MPAKKKPGDEPELHVSLESKRLSFRLRSVGWGLIAIVSAIATGVAVAYSIATYASN